MVTLHDDRESQVVRMVKMGRQSILYTKTKSIREDCPQCEKQVGESKTSVSKKLDIKSER